MEEHGRHAGSGRFKDVSSADADLNRVWTTFLFGGSPVETVAMSAKPIQSYTAKPVSEVFET